MAYSYDTWKKRQAKRNKPSVSAPIFSEFKSNWDRENPKIEQEKPKWQTVDDYRRAREERARQADSDRFAGRYLSEQAREDEKARNVATDRFSARYMDEAENPQKYEPTTPKETVRRTESDRFAGRYMDEAENPNKYVRPVTPQPDVQSKKENKRSILSRVFENAKTQLDKPEFHERQLEANHGGERDMLKGFFEPNNVNNTYSENSGAGLRLGIGQTIEGVGDTINWAASHRILGADHHVGDAIKKGGQMIAKGFEDEQQDFEVGDWNNPDYLTSAIPQALPQVALSWLPMIGTATWLNRVQKLSKLPKLAKYLMGDGVANGVQTTIDSSIEAGSVFDEAISRGMTVEEAKKAGDEAFGKNLLLHGSTNFIELGLMRSKLGKTFEGLNKGVRLGTRAVGGGLVEGLEEGTQEAISASALGDEFRWTDPSTVEAMYLGGLLGTGITGIVAGVKEVKDAMAKMPKMDSPSTEIIESALNELPPEIRQEFDEAVRSMEERDIPREEALEIVAEQLLDRTPAFGDILEAKQKEYIASKKLEQQSTNLNPITEQEVAAQNEIEEEQIVTQPLEGEPPSLLNMETNEIPLDTSLDVPSIAPVEQNFENPLNTPPVQKMPTQASEDVLPLPPSVDVQVGDTVNLQGTRPETGYVVQAVEGEQVQVLTPNQTSIKVPKSRIVNLLHREAQEAELEQQLEQQIPLETEAFEQQIPQEVTTSEQQMPQEVATLPQETKSFDGVTLARRNKTGKSTNPEDRPQGLYTSMVKDKETFASPFEDEGDVTLFGKLKAKNPLVLEELVAEHARFGGRKSGYVSSGISALHQLVGETEFKKLMKLPKSEVKKLLEEQFPGPNYDRYHDAYDLLEAYAAQLARTQGYDAFILEDKNDPDFSEVAVLNNSAIEYDKESKQEEPKKEKPKQEKPKPTEKEQKPQLDKSDELAKSYQSKIRKAAKDAGVNLKESVTFVEGMMKDEITSSLLESHNIKNGENAFVAGKSVVSKDKNSLNIDVQLSRVQISEPITQEVIHEFAEVWLEVWKQGNKAQYNHAVSFLKAKGMNQARAEEMLAEILTDYTISNKLPKAITENNIQKKFFGKIVDKFKHWVQDTLKRISYFRKEVWNQLSPEIQEQAKLFEEGKWKEAFASIKDSEFDSVERYSIKPSSDAWKRGPNFAEVKEMYPKLFEANPDEETTDRHPTQIATTVSTYNQFFGFLESEGFTGTILDASSGLGKGTKAGQERGLKVDDVEPFPDKDYSPKFTSYQDIKEQYDVVISNAVLNVLPQDFRDGISAEIGRLLKDGGRAFINVRGRDVEGAKGKKSVNEFNASHDNNMEYFIEGKNSFQKGFNKKELVAYLQDVLSTIDGNFEVVPMSKKNSGFNATVGAVVTRKDGAKYSIKELGTDPILADYEKYFGIRNSLLEEYKKNPKSFTSLYRGEIVPTGDGINYNLAPAVIKKPEGHISYEQRMNEKIAELKTNIEEEQNNLKTLQNELDSVGTTDKNKHKNELARKKLNDRILASKTKLKVWPEKIKQLNLLIKDRKEYILATENNLLYLTPQQETANKYAEGLKDIEESKRPDGYNPTVFEMKVKLEKTADLRNYEDENIFGGAMDYAMADDFLRDVANIKNSETREEILDEAGFFDNGKYFPAFRLFKGKVTTKIADALREQGYDSVRYTEFDQDNYIVLDRKKVLYQHEWESVTPKEKKKKTAAQELAEKPKKNTNEIDYDLIKKYAKDEDFLKMLDEEEKKDKMDTNKKGKAFTENGTRIEFEYRVVEVTDLIISNDANGNVNPNYPKELQPRDRSRKASQVQIQNIAQKLNPILVGESPKASDGAPIVGPDMVVESGNGRTLAIQKMYEELYSPWQAYNEFLGRNADKFGLDKTAIHEMEYPILVRVRTNKVDRKQFVSEANEASVAAMSAAEQAAVDAGKMNNKLMTLFMPAENGELNTSTNRAFITAFMGDVVAKSERGRYMTSEGALSQEGLSRVRNAVFAKAYGNNEAISLLAESTDNNVRNVINAMLKSAPRFAIMKDSIANDALYNEDITTDIVDAMVKLAELRKEGTSVKSFLDQTSLFDEVSAETKEMLLIFEDKEFKRSAKALSELFGQYVNVLEVAGSPSQIRLFQETPPTKAEILATALKRVKVDENGEVQTNLFETESQSNVETGTTTKQNREKQGETIIPPKKLTLDTIINGNDPEYNENISVGDTVYFDIGTTRFTGTVLEIPPANQPRALALIDIPSGKRTVPRNKLVKLNEDEKPKSKPRASKNSNEEGFAGRKKNDGPPTDGTETVDSTQNDKTVTRTQIIDFIQKEFKVTVGTGKTSGRLGFYKNKFAIMRTKDYGDFDVISHELGHHIDKHLGLSMNHKIRDEFIRLAEWNLEIPEAMSKDTRAKEGVAEYFSQVFYGESLSSKAMKIKDLSPELRKFVLEGLTKQKWNKPTTELKKMMDSWLNRDGEQELGGIYSPIGEKRKNKRTVKSIMNEVYTRVYDKDHPIWVAMRLIEKETGVKIDSNLDAYARAVLTRGTVARAATFVKGRTFDEHGRITGESFEAILEEVDNVENFDKYLIAKHALHLKTEKGKHKTPITPAKIEEYLASAKPEYEALAKRVYAYQQRALQVLVDGGLIDSKLPAKLKEKYPYYVPFYRVTTEDGMRDGPSGKGVREGQYANNENGLKGMKEHGSTKNIISPIESIIKNTHLYFSLADHNSVGRALAAFADPDNPQAAEITRTIIEAVEPDLRVTEIALEQIEKTLLNAGLEQEMTKELDMKAIAKIFEPIFRPNASKNEVMVWAEGKPKMFKIRDPLLYDALVAQDSRAINDIARFILKPGELANKALRQGITMSPFFTVITFARSAMQLGIKTEAKGLNYFTQPGRVIKAMWSVGRRDDALYDWWASGGAQSTFIATENDYLEKELENLAMNKKTKDMLKRKMSMKEKRELAFYMSKKGLGAPFKMLNVFNDILDQSVKLAEYQVVMKQTQGDRVKAALASREADLDYKRFGSTGMQFANKYWLFWNVAFQGPDNLFRYAAKNPARFGLRGFLLVTLPTLALYAMNRDDEEYQELTTFEKDMYWNIPKGDGTFWKIKIPFEAGILFKTIPEKLLGEYMDYKKKENKQSWKDFRKNTTETMLVNFLPTLFDTAAEYMAEKDLETGRDTVPMGVQSDNKPDEYDERTSEIFKAVGKFLNRSPILLEHAYKSLTGQMGQFYLYSTDVALDKLGIVDRPNVKGLTRNFRQRTFTTSVKDGSTNAIDTFYPEYARLKQDHKDNGVNGRPSPLLKAFGRANDDMIALRKVKKGMFYNHLVQLDGSPFPYDEKKRRIVIIDNALRDIARDVQGLDPLDQKGLEEAWKMAEGYKDYVKYNNKLERDKFDEENK